MKNVQHVLKLSKEEEYLLGVTGERIMGDRYLLKGGDLKVGATVVAVLDKKTNLHDLGEIVDIEQEGDHKKVTVRLRDGGTVVLEANHVEPLKETSPKQMNARIAKGVVKSLKKDKRELYETKFKNELLKDFSYIPGGRINASMGTNVKTTSYNCFVLPNIGPRPKDYATSFGRTLEIQARSGGVGMNLSLIPPKGMVSPTQKLRKTDLQLVMDVWHPDVLEFANTSYPHSVKAVRLNAAFKEALAKNTDWQFEFPDAKKYKNYDKEWDGDLETWKKNGKPVVTGETKPAREIYEALIHSNGTAILDELMVFYKPIQVKDDRNSIAEALGEQWEHQVKGHPVAMILSSLRPRYFKVEGVNGRSSGAYSWGTLYDKGNWAYAEGFGPVAVAEIMSTGCQLIIQGGSRRGALMVVLNDWHQDLLSFINAKQQDDFITGANMSVGFSDEFMEAVEQKGHWNLGYVKEELFREYEKQYHIKPADFTQTETMHAESIWEQAMNAAHTSAEPGVIFLGRYNLMSNAASYAPTLATNPCGEQGLPAWAVCNLGAVNLAKIARGWHDQFDPKVQVFADKGKEKRIRKELVRIFGGSPLVERLLWNVKWEELENIVRLGLRFQDAVIDSSYYPYEENRKQQLGERRVGLGFMGLHDLLIYNGVRYGSEESEKFCEVLLGMMCEWCYLESVELAKENGPFPFYDQEGYLSSGFMKQMAVEKPHVVEAIKKHGIRNVTSMTVAPTGSTGTMIGVSTGCEPHYAWEYKRNSRLGSFKERVRIVKEYRDAHPEFEVMDDYSDLPDYFVTSMQLTPEEHVAVQATLQKWIDSSISKTCNAPSTYKVEDVRALYELAYKRNGKGVTIYVDKSRAEQVLEVETPDIQETVSIPVKSKNRSRTPVLYGATYEKATPEGDVFITINDDSEHLAREIVVNIGKAGTSTFAFSEAIGRALTLYLKESDNPDKEAKIIKHFSGIGGLNSVGFGPNKITSVADAIAKSLVEHIETFPMRKLSSLGTPKSGGGVVESSLKQWTEQRDLCPNCNQMSMVRIGGCSQCEACDHSLC